MRTFILVLTLMLPALTACDSPQQDASEGEGEGEGEGEPARCERECASADDCTTADIPPFGPENWSCEEGACLYLGCNEGECFGDDTCESLPEYDDVPFCIVGCSADVDCGDFVGTQGRVVCAEGLCRPRGCVDDAECEGVAPGFLCKDIGTAISECRQGCADVSDCQSNVPQKCEEGFCQDDACLSDDDCASEGFACFGN